MHVVLVRPQIATNTGNIIRLCANTGATLHLVGPLGFDMAESRLRRAGLDYHDLAVVHLHDSLTACRAALTPGGRWFGFSASATVSYNSVAYAADDVLVFGAERTGLTAADMKSLDQILGVPMRPGNRSLNLANAVAVVVYEAWRQSGFVGASMPLQSEPGHGLVAESLTEIGIENGSHT